MALIHHIKYGNSNLPSRITVKMPQDTLKNCKVPSYSNIKTEWKPFIQYVIHIISICYYNFASHIVLYLRGYGVKV